MSAFSAFILTNTRHGAMLVNRFDHMDHSEPGYAFGVGGELLQMCEYHSSECNALGNLMVMRRNNYGPGVVVLDVGANIGAHTCRWARALEGWGEVHAFEAQERVFYALAGNLTLGNHFNAHAYHTAVGSRNGRLGIPTMNHAAPGNFGGLHLRPTDSAPGQRVSYTEGLEDVALTTIDRLALPRVDVIKLDVEGMEVEVLAGAAKTIDACRPVVYAEHNIAGLDNIKFVLPGYVFMEPLGGADVLCIHGEDPILETIRGGGS